MKSKILGMLIILLFAAGYVTLNYPVFGTLYNQIHEGKVIESYDHTVHTMDKERRKKYLEEAQAYNIMLAKENPQLLDAFSQETKKSDSVYNRVLNMEESGVMGALEIPKISLYLPIYHGTSEAVLQAGVGHFWGTSLPVGGENTHTVLTGHRGLPTKTLFTNMDKLEEGDIFYIKVLDETLAYQIDQILTVLPEETDALAIESGKDYATLVTCTPYAINTHRLLVRGHRIPYEEATVQEPDVNVKPELSFTAKVLIITVIVIFIGLILTVIYSIRDRKRRKIR